jgi:Tol biopolymer transport system component
MTEPDGPTQPGPRRALLAGLLALAVVAAGIVAVLRPWTDGEPAHRSTRAGGGVPSPRPGSSSEPIAADPTHKIAFASRAVGGLFHIHVINADGSGDTSLTFGTGEERDPAWSPDRTRIAFDRRVASADPHGSNADVYVMMADGTGSIRITSGPGEEGDPAWSPDGSRVAFFATDPVTGRKRIALQRLDGGPQASLSDPPDRCNDREPTWSPDGLQLVFVRKCGDQPSALYVLDLTVPPSRGLLLLTAFGRTPDWSPDGARIVYTGIGAGGPSVYVINVDGTGKTKLSDGPLSGDPEWSPDGTRIVFAVGDPAAVHLFVMNADGSGVRRLTSNTADDVTASW